MNENDMNEFWEIISEVDYVILRNYENIIDDLMNGGDIDILVDNKTEFINTTKAISISPNENCYNYFVIIGENKIPIDLREVGDGYYDKVWEKDMLKRKRKKGAFYIIDGELYQYSIFYHFLMHKKKIPDKYLCFMKQHGFKNKRQLIRALDMYMWNNGYNYVIPKDVGVEFNKSMFLRRRICSLIKGIKL